MLRDAAASLSVAQEPEALPEALESIGSTLAALARGETLGNYVNELLGEKSGGGAISR